MGALSVVICAILSHFFLNESLTTFGALGCALCIVRTHQHVPYRTHLTRTQVGSVVIALNGPQEATVGQILAFQKLFLSPGFLVRFSHIGGSVFRLTAVLCVGVGQCRYPRSLDDYHILCS